jgi:hypothetical protein
VVGRIGAELSTGVEELTPDTWLSKCVDRICTWR